MLSCSSGLLMNPDLPVPPQEHALWQRRSAADAAAGPLTALPQGGWWYVGVHGSPGFSMVGLSGPQEIGHC